MFTRYPSLRWSMLLAAATACAPGPQDPNPQNLDAGTATDAGVRADAGLPPPPVTPDAGTPPPVVDAGGSTDPETPMDAGSMPDAATEETDAGATSVEPTDAGVSPVGPGAAGSSAFTASDWITLPVYNTPLSSAADGGTLDENGIPSIPNHYVGVKTFVPEGDGPFEPVLITHGKFLAPRYYQYLAEHLASHGYLAVLTDMNGAFSHENMSTYLGQIIDWLEDQNAGTDIEGVDAGAIQNGDSLAGRVKMDALALAGHSMGGKLSLLLASKDERPKAVFAIDPVDAMAPSVTPELMGSIDVPVVYVGETTDATGSFQSCAPQDNNFQQYFANASGPALEIDVKGANHMSFIERDLLCVPCSACNAGTDDPEKTRELTRRWIVAFFGWALRGDDSQRYWLTGEGMQADVDQQLVTFQTKNAF